MEIFFSKQEKQSRHCSHFKSIFYLFFLSFILSFNSNYAKDNPYPSIPTKVTSSISCAPTIGLAPIQPIKSGNWNDVSIWPGGKFPTLNDNVTIPSNFKVTLLGTCRASSIYIDGTLNALNTQAGGAWIDLETTRIVVRNGGLLGIGTENQPYVANKNPQGIRCQITLRGGKINNAPDDYKAIMAMSGGTIQMHGYEKKSWTQLNRTAAAGSNSLQLKEAVNWEVGDQIVIAPSGFDANETEIRTITGINGTTITLDSALKFRHYGRINTYKNGQLDFDLRAEVGLLSRYIKIQGDAASSTSRFGGHMMFMNGSDVKMSGVELNRLGQEGITARYPVHWHIAGNASGQYVKNSTIHESYNRAVTIHGTDNVLIEEVVAYDFIGHGFFLEDGDEEGNIFRNNFGIRSKLARPNFRVEPFDEDTSVFWITNPNNTWIGNVAAASDGAGFWFVPVIRPLRPGNWGGYNPRQLRIKLFKDNVGHSNEKFNIGIDNTINSNKQIQINMDYVPRKPNRAVDTTYIDNFTGYHSRSQSYWSRMAGPDVLRNSKLGGSREQLFQSFHGAVENTLFVGKFEGFDYNRMSKRPAEFLGAQMYNGSTDFKNIHLAGFADTNTNCIGTRRSSGKYPNFTISGVTFEGDIPAGRKVKFDGNGLLHPGRSYVHASGLIDIDGSISGVAGARLTPRIKTPPEARFAGRIFDEGFNITPDAVLRQDWNAYYTTNADFGTYFFRNSWGEAYRNNEAIAPYYLIRSDGQAVYDHPRIGRDINFSPIVNNTNYRYNIQSHKFASWLKADFRWVRQNSTLYTNFLNVPSGFVVRGAREVSSMAALEASNVTAYFFSDNTVRIKSVADKVSNIQNTSVNLGDYSANEVQICRYGDCRGGANTNILNYVTLVDYGKGDDSRDQLIAQSGIQSSPLTYTANGVNFSITTDGDGINEYVDYQLNFDRQVWTDYFAFEVDYQGPNFTMFINDKEQGLVSFGRYAANNSNAIEMGYAKNIGEKDNVIGVILRIYESDIAANLNSSVTQNITLKGINLLSVAPNNYSRSLPDIAAPVVPDTDGDGYTDAAEQASCRSMSDASDLSFDFNRNDEDFELNQITSIGFTPQGVWHLVGANSNDPKIVKSNLSFSGNAVPTISVRIRSERSGEIDLFWSHANSNNFSANKSSTKNYVTANQWQVLTFDVKDHPEWSGKTITALRLDFVPDANARVNHWFDWMRGPNGTDCSSLSVADFDTSKKLLLYPNPVKNILNISGNQGDKLLEVYNVLGAVQVTKTFSAATTTIDLSGLSAGIYIVRVINMGSGRNSQQQVYRVVKAN